MDLSQTTISQIRQLLLDKKIKAVDIVKYYLDRIKKYDPQIKSFITVTKKLASKQAKIIDDKIAAGQQIGALAGSVMAVKDNFMTKNVESTAGSKVLKGYLPEYSSTIYDRLLAEDTVLIGKTNTDCFTFGGSTENSGYFTTHNPWNLSMIPGGSSGGSAAAQAASLCTIALGTDTGGSIRQPASLCGITGLKPTYGRNSRYGITSMASSFDCPGSFGHSVEDIAQVLKITAGQDSFDATSSQTKVDDYPSLLSSTKLTGLKIGLPKEYFAGSINPEVRQKVLDAAKVYETAGAQIIDVTLPSTDLGIAVYYVLVPCEISANMARYDGIRFGQSRSDAKDILSYYLQTRGDFMEPELKRRILIGTYALSAGYFDAYYLKAAKVRTLIKNEFVDTFKKVDVILAPVSPTTAWPIGQKVNNPLEMYLADVYTCCINVAGLPGLALPCGFDSQNLPVGFQLIGNYFEESKILSAGHQYQKLTDFHLQTPCLPTGMAKL